MWNRINWYILHTCIDLHTYFVFLFKDIEPQEAVLHYKHLNSLEHLDNKHSGLSKFGRTVSSVLHAESEKF